MELIPNDLQSPVILKLVCDCGARVQRMTALLAFAKVTKRDGLVFILVPKEALEQGSLGLGVGFIRLFVSILPSPSKTHLWCPHVGTDRLL